PGPSPAVPPYVVQGRTDRRGQLPGRHFFQPNGLGRRRHRHLIRLDGQDERAQIPASRRGGRERAARAPAPPGGGPGAPPPPGNRGAVPCAPPGRPGPPPPPPPPPPRR